MAGMIPKDFIHDLINQTDIVDVIDYHVPLKKVGRNHKACCPFHTEKTASFTVSQERQIYHCFGCGAGGNVISFLMAYLNMEFIDAIEELASRSGRTIPYENKPSTQTNKTNELYELMQQVAQFYTTQLKRHKQKARVVDYLKQRGISTEVAAKFELGFAAPGWDNLINAFNETPKEQLVKIGAINKHDSNNRHYDYFRNRLIFPIHDQRGRVIGLGGRVLDDNTPKYLNSPETPIFNKRQELYGLYQARKTLKEIECFYMVEGYMDVISLVQAGIYNVVATLGTAATPEHIQKIFRFTNKIVFCFDGDDAGKKAAWRGLENALPLLQGGKQVYFIFLPKGDDPDTFVRQHGKDSFSDTKIQTPLSEFLFQELALSIDLTIFEGRAEMINKTLPYLKKMPADPYQRQLAQKLSETCQHDINDILGRLATPSTPKPTHQISPPSHEPSKGDPIIRWLISCLLKYPNFAQHISTQDLAPYMSSGIKFLAELIELIKRQSSVNMATILENYRGTKYEKRLMALYNEKQIVEMTEEEFLDAFHKKVAQLKKQQPLQNLKTKKSLSELTAAERDNLRNMQK